MRTTLDNMNNEVKVDCLSVILAAKKMEKTPLKVNTPQQRAITRVYNRKKKSDVMCRVEVLEKNCRSLA